MLTAERRSMLGTTPADTGKVAIFTNDVAPESVDAIRAGKITRRRTTGSYLAEDAHLVAVAQGAAVLAANRSMADSAASR